MSFFSIEAIAHRLATQDNACTAHPVFVVEEQERIYGVELDRAEGRVWIDADGEILEPRVPGCVAFDCDEVGYVNRWRFVVACFTREAAQRYIDENRHNLTEPRVYVASAHRNREWQVAAASFKVMARATARLERFVGKPSGLTLNLFGMIDTLVRRVESRDV